MGADNTYGETNFNPKLIMNPTEPAHLTPSFELLKTLSECPSDEIDSSMIVKLKELEGKTTEEVKVGIKYILDACVYNSLCSGFVIYVLDFEWRRLGGKMSDPRTFMPEITIGGNGGFRSGGY